jgi:hypothetical protein
MSTLSEREAALRRALHAAADAFEPGSDGLQRIQARLGRPRPVAVAWVEAAWLDLRLSAPAALQSVLDRIAGGGRLAWQRFGPTPRRPGHRASRSSSWLRPLAALGVTVFIVAAGAYVAIDAQQAIFPSSSSSAGSSGGSSGQGGQANGGLGGANSHGQSPFGATSTGAAPSPSCKTVKRRGASPSSSQSNPQVQSSSPSPGPDSSSTGTGSLSPSTGDSSSTDAGSVAPTDSSDSGASPGPGSLAPSSGVTSTAPASTRSLAPKASMSPCASKHPTASSSSPATQLNNAVQPVVVQPVVVTQPTQPAPGASWPFRGRHNNHR